ncbi:MAG: hypothetical protein IJX13_08700 [Clostridia bacterium]|nr:hypothetical protein [Clostridia bacterium]
MGFGYLLMGYLTVFLLYILASSVGVGPFALLIGYLLMLYGLLQLRRFQSSFSIAAILTLPLSVTAVLECVKEIFTWLLWDIPFWGTGFTVGLGWTSFLLLICFQFAMLYGIRMLSMEVGLPKITSAAVRNTLFVGIYACVYIVGQFPASEWLRPYLTLSVNLLNLICAFCNLLLLLSCNKNICAAGDEEVTPKRSRFDWVNRMDDKFESLHQTMNEGARKDGEELMRRHLEKKNKKKKK